jgi:hypothetical protein
MRTQTIGDVIVVANATAKTQHIGPASGLLVRGSGVLRQCGAWRGKQEYDEDGTHWVLLHVAAVKRQSPERLLGFTAGRIPVPRTARRATLKTICCRGGRLFANAAALKRL